MPSSFVIKTKLGNFLLTENDRKLSGFLPTEEDLTDEGLLSTFSKNIRTQTNEYLSGKRKKFDVNLNLSGTEFQKKVWNTVFTEIEYGEVVTYSDIADIAGHPRASRAVGSSLKKIPIIIIIPCHRVVAKNHGGNYKYGKNMKNWLLTLESKNS